MSTDCNTQSDSSPYGTIADWVIKAEQVMQDAGLFFGHGTATARDEACWMVSNTLRWPPDFDSGLFEQMLEAEQTQVLNELLLKRVETRKPLAYLIDEAWFAGLRFKVNADTLIPRSPLAELIVDGMAPWLDFNQPLRVLEVGTGSGCIAAAMAWHWPNLQIDASDISPAALDLAQHNLDQLQVSHRVRLIQADVFEGVGLSAKSRYDLIISNPPYVPQASMWTLPREYQHEPDLALVAGKDGLDIVRRLVLGAPEFLNDDGWLVVEVGEAQPQAQAWLADAEPLWLEFEHGGEGVFLMSRAACLNLGVTLENQ
ncbi:MAG: 50S ribosomal protein L3 N(5)-glutamine methyltransferase [Pseudomonadota bacterium]